MDRGPETGVTLSPAIITSFSSQFPGISSLKALIELGTAKIS